MVQQQYTRNSQAQQKGIQNVTPISPHTPHSIESERGLLGSVLVNPRRLSDVVEVIEPDDFFFDAHGVIFKAMLSLYRRDKKPTILNVTDELARQGTLEQIGGELYLEELQTDIQTLKAVRDHADIVRRTAQHRHLISATQEIAQAAYSQEENALELAEKLIYEIALHAHDTHTVRTLGDALDDYLIDLTSRYAKQNAGEAVGVPTGFVDLDRMLGGMQPSDLLILAARPSVGKTALSMNIAMYVASHAKRALFFSLEMSEKQLVQRILAMETPLDQSRLRDASINDVELDAIHETARRLHEYELCIDDTTRTLAALRSKARRMHAIKPLNLLIVDYLQLVHVSSDRNTRQGTRAEEVAQISRGLKELAKELAVPVLALAQLNRAVESRGDKVPQLSDLKESGAIEQDADTILFLHVTPDELKKRTECLPYNVSLNVGKQRNGRVGEVPLTFKPRSTKFVTLSLDSADEEL